MKKILHNKGESLAETLVAILVMTMGLTILAGAIVTSARVNAKVKNQDEAIVVSKNKNDASPVVSNRGSITVRILNGSESVISADSTSRSLFVTNNGYYYYE